MKNIQNPNDLLLTLEVLEPSNSEYVLVVLDGSYNLISITTTTEKDYLSTITEVTTELLAQGHYDGNAVFLRGKDTYNPENKDAYEHMVADASEFALLDLICVDWTEGTHYSDMCDMPSSCCGPDNQTIFRTKAVELV
jgi:hypothetical protein